jgi:hypothetical protein
VSISRRAARLIVNHESRYARAMLAELHDLRVSNLRRRVPLLIAGVLFSAAESAADRAHDTTPGP